MNENRYQAQLIKKLGKRFPGCVITKTDSGYRQGFPDLILLWGSCWAALEVKTSWDSLEQPNQAHYISQLGTMSFAAFIYPENEEDILNALQQAFESAGRTCVPQS